MKRREFIVLFGCAIIGEPAAAIAQQSVVPIIGLLASTSPDEFAPFVAAFRRGLSKSGYVEGQNIAIEFHWAKGQYHLLPELAADLVRRQAAVIVVVGGNNPAMAAKAATATIPIVSVLGSDPVKLSLVDSLSRPGGNITGVSLLASTLVAKRFELLRELVPGAVTIAFLVNPENPNAEPDTGDALAAARTLGLRLVVLRASASNEFDTAFESLREQRAGALVVSGDGFFTSQRQQLVTLALRHALPAIYPWPEYAQAGGLISYGTSLIDAYHQIGIMTARILKGIKPADLPVEQSTKLELVINLKTAMTLGLTVPPSLLARADEVIE